MGVYWWMRVEAVLKETWLSEVKSTKERRGFCFTWGLVLRLVFAHVYKPFKNLPGFPFFYLPRCPVLLFISLWLFLLFWLKINSQRKGRSSQDLSDKWQWGKDGVDLSNRKALVPQSGSGVCFTTYLSSVTLAAGSPNTEPEKASCFRKQLWHDYLELQAHRVCHCDWEAIIQGAVKVNACIRTSQPGRD